MIFFCNFVDNCDRKCKDQLIGSRGNEVIFEKERMNENHISGQTLTARK